MNRFPKMMVLWTAKFTHDGLDFEKALAFGYAAAVQFARAKYRSVGKGKKRSSQRVEKPQEAWDFYPVKELPFKGITYRVEKDGIYVKIGDKVENATLKARKQLQQKFKTEKLFKIYYQVANSIVERINWKRWYKVWKSIRDFDWDSLEVYPILKEALG